jgi:thiol-disulfide isomerase/thioredoxin
MSPSTRFAAATVALALLAAACSGGGSGSDTINLGDGGLAPPVGDVSTEPTQDNVLGLEYATFDGDTARFDDHLGTPLVINFFAEWCPNCIAEMPDFETVSQELAGQVNFVGMSIDQASGDALQLVEDTGVTYDIGWDPSEEIFNHFRPFAMPTTVFVNADGTIARVWSGALDGDALRDKISEEIL